MYYKNEVKVSRDELAELAGQIVPCVGCFIDVKIANKGFTSLLFRDIKIGELHYDHMWVVCNESFKGKNLKHNCIVSFDGTVQKYSGSDRYGVSFCHNVKIVKYDVLSEDAYSDMFVKIKTINYKSYNDTTNAKLKGHEQFGVDYGLDKRQTLRLVYNPINTLRNNKKEIEFDFYDDMGKMAEFEKISFNPYIDDHKISVDDKYYIKINETVYRKLCLLYFMARNNLSGCMSYIPSEEVGNYVEVVDGKKSDFYYKGDFILSIKKDSNEENDKVIGVV